jgi:type II secretory pathway component PulF
MQTDKDIRRQYKSLQRLITEAILVIVAGLVIGYYLGVIIP